MDVEIVARIERRRQWTPAEKSALLAEVEAKVSVWPATCSDERLGPRYCGPLGPPSVAPEGGLPRACCWSAIGAAPS